MAQTALTEPDWSRAIDSIERAEQLLDALLQRCVIHVGERQLRPVEVELYLRAEHHQDPFTHGHPAQERAGFWYLHRAGPKGGFKSGSFKGMDLACGRPGSPAGVLIRSFLRDDGALICGPSLCVDELMAQAGAAKVAELHGKIGEMPVESADNPARLVVDDSLSTRQVFRTARVGLTLKNESELALRMQYVIRRHRWLSAPRAIKKGRVLLILALLEDGWSDADIRALTGSPAGAIGKARAEMSAGRVLAPDDFVGASLDSATLARMYGCLLARR